MSDKKVTSAKPHVVGGLTFRCYHSGVLTYVWETVDHKCGARARYSKSTYSAYCRDIETGGYKTVMRKNKPVYFRTLDNALKAAAEAYHL